MTETHPHDDTFGEFAQELRALAETLLERIEPALRRAAADGREWDSCSWCPVCAAAALVRGEHHDVVAAVADHGTAIVTVLREALAGVPVEPLLPDDFPEFDEAGESPLAAEEYGEAPDYDIPGRHRRDDASPEGPAPDGAARAEENSAAHRTSTDGRRRASNSDPESAAPGVGPGEPGVAAPTGTARAQRMNVGVGHDAATAGGAAGAGSAGRGRGETRPDIASPRRRPRRVERSADPAAQDAPAEERGAEAEGRATGPIPNAAGQGANAADRGGAAGRVPHAPAPDPAAETRAAPSGRDAGVRKSGSGESARRNSKWAGRGRNSRAEAASERPGYVPIPVRIKK